MGVVRSPNGTTRSGRVLGYKMSREARRKLAQQKAIRERSKEGRAGVVKVGKFSSQIPLSQTTGVIVYSLPLIFSPPEPTV